MRVVLQPSLWVAVIHPHAGSAISPVLPCRRGSLSPIRGPDRERVIFFLLLSLSSDGSFVFFVNFPDPTCFFLPPLYAALLLCNALLRLFSFLPPFTPHCSWTPTLRYSVYKHRYGHLSLLTPPTPPTAAAFPLPVSPLRSSLSWGRVLHGLHWSKALLINVLFPLGNKAA